MCPLILTFYDGNGGRSNEVGVFDGKLDFEMCSFEQYVGFSKIERQQKRLDFICDMACDYLFDNFGKAFIIFC